MHRSGSALNRHVHYDCCIIAGLFEPREVGQIRSFHAPALRAEEIADIGEQVRRRVLRGFAGGGRLAADDPRDRFAGDNGGFSLAASARIAEHDRARLLRHCARPPFALERIGQVNAHQVLYHLPRPRRDGWGNKGQATVVVR